MYKLEAPQDSTSIIGDQHNPGSVRIILGVGYTDRPTLAEWARDHGYTVTKVDETPAEHLQRLARLTAWPSPIVTGRADGADPDQKYRFTGPDGHTQYDIRDVLSGAVTA